MSPRSANLPPGPAAAAPAQRRPVLGLVQAAPPCGLAAPRPEALHQAVLVMASRSLVAEGIARVVDPLQARWRAHFELLHAPDLEAAQDILARQPALLLAVLDLPGNGGEEHALLRALSETHPGVPVLALSADCSPARVRALLQAGVRGVLPHAHTPRLLQGVLELMLQFNGVYVPAEACLGETPPQASINPMPVTRATALGLTARQEQVLQLLLQGNANKRICQQLGVSAATVKSHLSAVMRALKVDNRTQAAMAASRMGLVFDTPPPSPTAVRAS